MRIVRAVAAAAAVWFTGSILVVFLREAVASIQQLEDLPGQIVWVAGPQLVISVAMVAVAGFAYGRRATRHGPVFNAAVLVPVLVDIVQVAVLGLLGEVPTAVVVARTAAALIGAALGRLLLRRFGPSRS